MAYTGCFLSLLSVIYFRELLPFREKFTNVIAIVAQYVILIVFIAATMIETDTLDTAHLSGRSLGIGLLLANVLLITLLGIGGLLRYMQEPTENSNVNIEWAVTFTSSKVAPLPFILYYYLSY